MNILQIGCNNGNDHVFSFVSSHKEFINKLVLVDACEIALDKAKKLYSSLNLNIEFINKAVTTNNEDTVTFYIPETEPDSAHSSTVRSVVNGSRLGKERLIEKKVQACNIVDLLELFDSKLIDRMYSDTEGLDCLIVNSIDLQKYKIPYIQFEFSHSDGHFQNGVNLTNCTNHLSKNDYILMRCNEYDLLAIKFK